MSYLKCPNCGKNVRLSADKSKIICDFCASEFLVRSNEAESPDEEVCLALRLFDISGIKNFENEHCIKAWEEMCAWINNGDTVESCLECLKNLALSHEKEWAVDTYNNELFNKIKPKVYEYMSSDERMLFYKDNGILSVGKAGTLITDKKIYCIKNRSVYLLSLSDIYSIHALPLFCSGSWYFNSNRNVEIDNIACSRIEQGVIMALVCLLVQRHRGKGYKIKVYNGVL
ncbi:MAG: hypothetical protein ACI4DY_10395 [Monoglobaceae bacterium]